MREVKVAGQGPGQAEPGARNKAALKARDRGLHSLHRSQAVHNHRQGTRLYFKDRKDSTVSESTGVYILGRVH